MKNWTFIVLVVFGLVTGWGCSGNTSSHSPVRPISSSLFPEAKRSALVFSVFHAPSVEDEKLFLKVRDFSKRLFGLTGLDPKISNQVQKSSQAIDGLDATKESFWDDLKITAPMLASGEYSSEALARFLQITFPRYCAKRGVFVRLRKLVAMKVESGDLSLDEVDLTLWKVVQVKRNVERLVPYRGATTKVRADVLWIDTLYLGDKDVSQTDSAFGGLGQTFYQNVLLSMPAIRRANAERDRVSADVAELRTQVNNRTVNETVNRLGGDDKAAFETAMMLLCSRNNGLLEGTEAEDVEMTITHELGHVASDRDPKWLSLFSCPPSLSGRERLDYNAREIANEEVVGLTAELSAGNPDALINLLKEDVGRPDESFGHREAGIWVAKKAIEILTSNSNAYPTLARGELARLSSRHRAIVALGWLTSTELRHLSVDLSKAWVVSGPIKPIHVLSN